MVALLDLCFALRSDTLGHGREKEGERAVAWGTVVWPWRQRGLGKERNKESRKRGRVKKKQRFAWPLYHSSWPLCVTNQLYEVDDIQYQKYFLSLDLPLTNENLKHLSRSSHLWVLAHNVISDVSPLNQEPPSSTLAFIRAIKPHTAG